MAENFKKKFQCAGCYEVYDEAIKAVECLKDCSQPDEVFACEICDEIYQMDSSAKRCCFDEETNEITVPARILEAHGQQPLF